jgi:thiol-disulfide isomerase/thioredoxin
VFRSFREGPGASGPFFFRSLASAAALAAVAGAAPADSSAGRAGARAPEGVEVSLSRIVANVEFSRGNLMARPIVPGVLSLPAVGGRAWHGGIPRRLPDEVARLGHDHFVPFVADYLEGKPVRAWCDEDLDGDLTDQSPVPLAMYPGIEGARSFLATFRWRTRAGGRSLDVERTIRVVLEPEAEDPDVSPPPFRLQSVFAMTGTAELEGQAYQLLLLDGDGDGLYSRSLFDGVIVDVDRDRHFIVDPMGPDFASFDVPFDAGGRAWVISAVDPEGRSVTLRATGPAVARAPAPAIGSSAPDFAITASDGRAIRLSALRGRPVLVYFWASTCRTCLYQAEGLVSLYERFHRAGLEIVGISYDTDRAAFEAFRANHHQTWPTSFSGRQVWEDPVGRLYRERGTGVLDLVDSSGTLIASTSRVADIESALPLLVAPKR